MLAIRCAGKVPQIGENSTSIVNRNFAGSGRGWWVARRSKGEWQDYRTPSPTALSRRRVKRMVRRCHSIWVAMRQPHIRKPFREKPGPTQLLSRSLSPHPTGARLSETADAAAYPRAGPSESQTPKPTAVCSAVTAPPGFSTQPRNVCHGGGLPTWAGRTHSSDNQRSRL